jgi:superfamily II DNA or RNA helicase
MITITIGNVKSKITGLSEKQADFLYDQLSYEDEQAIFLKLRKKELFGIDLKKRLFQRKRGVFLTGLLPRVLTLLNDPNIQLVDNRTTADKVNYYVTKGAFPPSRYYQDEALKVILDNPLCAVEMATGTGKSLVINKTIAERGVNTLVIVPTLNLLDQFHSTAEYHFGSKYVGTHKSTKQKPITIANIQGIQKQDQEWWDFYQQIIIDEYHRQAADSYYDLAKEFWEHVSYRVSLSATPFRNDNRDLKLEALAGPVLYSYKAKQAVKEGYIVAPYFVIYEIKNFTVPSNGWHSDYKQYIVDNKVRNNKIIEVAKKFLTTTNKNILILVNRIEHVNLLAEQLPDLVVVTGETKGNDKVFEDYRMGKIRGVIATSGVMSEGVDIPNIDVLILGGGYESEILISQAIGRVVRLDPERGKKFGIVVDFNDLGQKILERHSQSRIDTYEMTYGKEYIKYIK